MSQTMGLAERRAELDRRLDAALEASGDAGLATARSAVEACPDRWYGQLVALSHNAVADAPAPDDVLSASAAVELLRGYCRLRSGLFERLRDGDAGPPTRDPTDALLAGDYLNSAAYATLCAADSDRLESAFETLLSVSGSLCEAFDGRSAADAGEFLDETAGSLGEAAAVIGAALAGADESRRAQFGTFGRGFGTARQVRRVLASGGDPSAIAPREFDESRLQRHGERRREAGSLALERLSGDADVDVLRAFVDAE